jgi:thiosulfate dehydrogenase
MTRALTALSLAVAGAACRPVPAAEFGRQLFNDPRFAESRFNDYSCAICHSVSDAEAEKAYPGHTLYGAAARPSFWGGYQTRLIDAVSFCYVYFMRGPGPLDPDDPKSKALYEYLASLGPAEGAPALPYTVVRDAAGVARGDPARGAQIYDAACRACHGEAHTGGGRLTLEAPVLPEHTADYEHVFHGVAPAVVVVEKVRHGQFFGVGGNMPPFGREMLSDEDLGALLAFFRL